MLNPAMLTEAEALAAYIDEQAGAIVAAALGLTDDQARVRSCRSALSIGGLVKHATFVMEGSNGQRDHDELTEADLQRFTQSFALDDDERLDDALSAFARARRALRQSVLEADPGAEISIPSAPWFGRLEATPATARFQLLHLVEEMARHAGHADIIREQLDGAGAGPLMLAEEGLSGNDFMAPWTAEAAAAGDPRVLTPQ